MVFNLNSREIKVSNYYDLVEKAANVKSSEYISNSEKAVCSLDKLLDESVTNSLIADVPLGVLLSGGLDSSLIAAYASRNKKDLKTFSVIFPNHLKYNEQSHARKVADFLKTDHVEINAEAISPELIENLAYFFDEPFSDISMLPTYVLSEAVKQHCSVVLGGDGGDELFGGYPSYYKKMRLNHIAKFLPFRLRNNLSSIFLYFLSTNSMGYSLLKGFGSNFNKTFNSFDPIFYSEDIKTLFKNDIPFSPDKDFESIDSHTILDFLTRISVGDFCSFLSEDVLVKVDRASMAHSLEVRSPFLSKKIIDFAFLNLHPDLKVRNGRTKIILKMLGKKILPDDFIYERKQGFSFPLGDLLLSENWRVFFLNKINNFESDILNKNFAKNLLERNGRQTNHRMLFSIIQFICWYEKYNISQAKF
jgi:asparagine synthase (glutamine-hydrolysing)